VQLRVRQRKRRGDLLIMYACATVWCECVCLHVSPFRRKPIADEKAIVGVQREYGGGFRYDIK